MNMLKNIEVPTRLGITAVFTTAIIVTGIVSGSELILNIGLAGHASLMVWTLWRLKNGY